MRERSRWKVYNENLIAQITRKINHTTTEMLHWTAVYIVALLEVALIAVFVAPGVPVAIQKTVFSLLESANVRRGTNILFGIIGVLFAGELITYNNTAFNTIDVRVRDSIRDLLGI